jgi:hypothetical protein
MQSESSSDRATLWVPSLIPALCLGFILASSPRPSPAQVSDDENALRFMELSESADPREQLAAIDIIEAAHLLNEMEASAGSSLVLAESEVMPWLGAMRRSSSPGVAGRARSLWQAIVSRALGSEKGRVTIASADRETLVAIDGTAIGPIPLALRVARPVRVHASCGMRLAVERFDSHQDAPPAWSGHLGAELSVRLERPPLGLPEEVRLAVHPGRFCSKDEHLRISLDREKG